MKKGLCITEETPFWVLRRRRIFDYFLKEGMIRASDLAQFLDCTPKAASMILMRLYRQGWLKRRAGGLRFCDLHWVYYPDLSRKYNIETYPGHKYGYHQGELLID